MSRVLIVDDEASICWAFRESLGDLGHHVEVAATAEEGLRIAGSGALDVVVLDVRLPGVDGLTAMRSFRERIGHAPIIIITAFGNLETAVKALEGGAFDYLVKPFDLDQATTVIKRALEKKQSREPVSGVPPPPRETEALIGSSPAMQELFKSIALVAPTDVPVLITGESGTGKELVARAIHRHSCRKGGPFLPICLAALNPGLVERELFGHIKGSFTGAVQDRAGLLELASGGTVLLDEIGDVSPSLQVKLLRAIEHREVTPVGDARPRFTDIRIIAATNRPLSELMAAGEFREDLFFRLSVFQIHLPSLRERREDIPALAEHFLRQARLADVAEAALGGDVLNELRTRAWTGNVRELRNVIEHAAIVARGQPIRPEHLPAAAASKSDLATPSKTLELDGLLAAWAERAFREQADPADTTLYEQFLQLAEPPILRAVLEQCGRNRAAAAQILGIHRATLRQKLRKYGID
jgi:DNA-binding NtrC family response regulator